MGLHPGPTSTQFQRRAGASHHEPPASLVQTAEVVVEQAMVALRARARPTVLAGTRANRLLTFLNRLRSRQGIIEQMGRMFPT